MSKASAFLISRCACSEAISDASKRSENWKKPWELKITVDQFLKNSRQDHTKIQAALDVSSSQIAIPHELA